jgi:hypothetical protein
MDSLIDSTYSKINSNEFPINMIIDNLNSFLNFLLKDPHGTIVNKYNEYEIVINAFLQQNNDIIKYYNQLVTTDKNYKSFPSNYNFTKIINNTNNEHQHKNHKFCIMMWFYIYS